MEGRSGIAEWIGAAPLQDGEEQHHRKMDQQSGRIKTTIKEAGPKKITEKKWGILEMGNCDWGTGHQKM